MAYRVKVDQNAEAELDEAMAWYEAKQTGLGLRLLDEFYDTVSFLKERPEIYSPVYMNFRRAPVKQFPFVVFYAIDEAQKQVIILSVWHTNRDPEKIESKLK